jgi:peptidoglycan/xylan/chitin deacetylase (PgdA/CDA1 family)
MKNKINSIFESLKNRVYRWRYWNHLVVNMRDHIHNVSADKHNQMLPYINKPGIVFSFDDSYRINDWYKYGKDIFGYYDVKVTFNINAIHHFEGKREHTQKEIDMLIELQSNGHEIAHHGFKHRKATEYSIEFGIARWLEDEVVSLLNWGWITNHIQKQRKDLRSQSLLLFHTLFIMKIIFWR